MIFRMLGSFEVIRGDEVITPSAPKLRQVLALLAIQANRVVPTRQLIDELWEEQPPPSSATTLQTYIYQLRKVLNVGDARPGIRPGPISLQTRLGGYLLGVPEESIDIRTFELLAAAGRRQLEEGQVERAAGTLRQALGLWRGSALADVSVGPVLQADLVRLNESRYSIHELRIDADLALNRHHELISELTGYTAQHPTHEGLHARLMLALYRAGRRSEALRLFQRIRSVLADELGLEPGPELQHLQRQILSAEPGPQLGPEPTETIRVSARPDPPMQLPVNVSLVGRDNQLERLVAVLRERSANGPAVVAVSGPPGVGVSAFCARAAHQVRAEFPDGQFYGSLRGGSRAAELLANFLEAVGIPTSRIPDELETRSQMFRNWTIDRKVLVLLDDVSDADIGGLLLPGGRHSAAIIGAHRRLFGRQIQATVDLRQLTVDQSIELLIDAAGRHRLQRDAGVARALAEICAGFPVPLRAVAGLLALRPHWSLHRLIQRLTPDRWLAELATGRFDIRLSVAARDQAMPRHLRLAFRCLAANTCGTTTVAEAARILDIDHGHAEAVLEQLVEFRLAEVAVPEGNPTEAEFSYWFQQPILAAGRALAPLQPAEGGTAPQTSNSTRRIPARPYPVARPA